MKIKTLEIKEMEEIEVLIRTVYQLEHYFGYESIVEELKGKISMFFENIKEKEWEKQIQLPRRNIISYPNGLVRYQTEEEVIQIIVQPWESLAEDQKTVSEKQKEENRKRFYKIIKEVNPLWYLQYCKFIGKKTGVQKSEWFSVLDCYNGIKARLHEKDEELKKEIEKTYPKNDYYLNGFEGYHDAEREVLDAEIWDLEKKMTGTERYLQNRLLSSYITRGDGYVLFLLKEEELAHIKELEGIMNQVNGEEGKVILNELDTYIRNILFKESKAVRDKKWEIEDKGEWKKYIEELSSIRFYIDMNEYINHYGYLRVNQNAITHILRKLRDSDDEYAKFIYQSLMKD